MRRGSCFNIGSQACVQRLTSGKKSTLDKNVLQNYRPVSNIRYYSKIIEKIASGQLQEHLQLHGLQEEYQSAYRAQHSTETKLLRVKTDILIEMDAGRAMLIVLLDLSAAFDTVDHQILLDRLSISFNITGVALRWIRSYLRDRSFRVSTGSDLSVSEDAEGLTLPFPKVFVLIMEYHRGQCLARYFLFSIPIIWATSFVNMESNTTYMRMTFNFIFPLTRRMRMLLI